LIIFCSLPFFTRFISDLTAYWLITKSEQGQGDYMKVPSRKYDQDKENKKETKELLLM